MENKELNLDIDYQVKKELEKEVKEGEEKRIVPTYAEMSKSYIDYAVNTSHEKMSGHDIRLWGRLTRKVDHAAITSPHTLKVNKEEIDLLKDSFSKALFPASMAKTVSLMIDAIMEL